MWSNLTEFSYLFLKHFYESGQKETKENANCERKRSVLRRQSRDTNRNIKRSVYCQYGQYSLTFGTLTLSLTKGQCSKRQTILSVLGVYRHFYILIVNMINSEKKKTVSCFFIEFQNLFSRIEYLENYTFNLFVVFSTLIFFISIF